MNSNDQNKQVNIEMKGKGIAALIVFIVMEYVVIYPLHRALMYGLRLGCSREGLAIYAGWLFVVLAANSTIRRHRGSKPIEPFVEKTLHKATGAQPVTKPQPAVSAAQNKQTTAVRNPKRITLSDVAGYRTTKESMTFLVSCLKNKDSLKSLGAKLPAGVLLYGPPGTGKTLMAAALAGSAGVPFFSANASEFINKYVGTGPAAIRRLYENARRFAPCVVFIDELDAIGGCRTISDNEEYRSTINALLSELDGIAESAGVMTIAATNRIEDLDSALIRPGRFDRKIAIPLPGREDRLEILKFHARNKPISKEVNLEQLAADTEGYSGAGLSILLNEAAISAAARRSPMIIRSDIDAAMFRSATNGEAVYSRNKEEQLITAWHEAGHALCMKLLCDRNVSRITIIGSTGGTNGITCSTSKQQNGAISKRTMENMIKAVYGGRAAEEILFGNQDDITASAVGDIKQATAMIREYLASYGMGSGLLNLSVLTGNGETPASYIEEANALAERLYRETVVFLSENKGLLESIANELQKKKTLNDEQLNVLINEYSALARRGE